MTDRIRTVSVTATIALVLGAIAVGLVKTGSANPVTSHLWRAAEAFASPGEFLWWATLGGAFSGHPHGFAGNLCWVAGTALFWFVVAILVLAAAARLRAWF